jgi:hypothetical protein
MEYLDIEGLELDSKISGGTRAVKGVELKDNRITMDVEHAAMIDIAVVPRDIYNADGLLIGKSCLAYKPYVFKGSRDIKVVREDIVTGKTVEDIKSEVCDVVEEAQYGEVYATMVHGSTLKGGKNDWYVLITPIPTRNAVKVSYGRAKGGDVSSVAIQDSALMNLIAACAMVDSRPEMILTGMSPRNNTAKDLRARNVFMDKGKSLYVYMLDVNPNDYVEIDAGGTKFKLFRLMYNKLSYKMAERRTPGKRPSDTDVLGLL